MAAAMRSGFKALYQRNEYAHQLTDDKLKNLIVEVTGKPKNAGIVVAIAGSFKACKTFANFDSASVSAGPDDLEDPGQAEEDRGAFTNYNVTPFQGSKNIGMAFGYTINLNLPDTDDPKVFNAIFTALRETLLRE